MLITLILGACAGYFAPMVEPQVRKAMENVTLAKIEVAEGEFDMLTLLLMLLAAAVLALLLGLNGGAIALLVGAILGVFGKRILAAFQGGSA